MVGHLLASDILRIPLTRPEKLFSGPDEIDQEFRALAIHWHPDTNHDADATDVTAHLSALRVAAHEVVKKGIWRGEGYLIVQTIDGRSFRIRFELERSTETGDVYYGRSALVWLISPAFADLTDGIIELLRDLRFGSRRMEDEIRRYLPTVIGVHKCAGGSVAIVVRKTDDVFMLSDLAEHLGGKVDPRHVAWMVSAIYNIACYLEFAGLCHGGITLESVFISPKFHSAMLWGGWWYAAKIGEGLRALPKSVHSVTPPDVLRDKKAAAIIDTTSIRSLGRALLGDQTGMTLRGVAPDPIVQFLRSPAGPSARQDYAEWQKAVGHSFGARRFVELKIIESDIFNKEK